MFLCIFSHQQELSVCFPPSLVNNVFAQPAQLLNCSACSQLAVCPSLSQELLNLPFADQLQHWRLQHWGGFNWKRPLVLNQLWGQYWFAALTTVATFQSLSQKWLKSNFASKSKLQNPILGPQMGKWETPFTRYKAHVLRRLTAKTEPTHVSPTVWYNCQVRGSHEDSWLLRAWDAAINALLPTSQYCRTIVKFTAHFASLPFYSLNMRTPHNHPPSIPLHLARARQKRVGLFQFEEGVNISGNSLYMGTIAFACQYVSLGNLFQSLESQTSRIFCLLQLCSNSWAWLNRPIWGGASNLAPPHILALTRLDSCLFQAEEGINISESSPWGLYMGNPSPPQPPSSLKKSPSTYSAANQYKVYGNLFESNIKPFTFHFPFMEQH